MRNSSKLLYLCDTMGKMSRSAQIELGRESIYLPIIVEICVRCAHWSLHLREHRREAAHEAASAADLPATGAEWPEGTSRSFKLFLSRLILRSSAPPLARETRLVAHSTREPISSKRRLSHRIESRRIRLRRRRRARRPLRRRRLANSAPIASASRAATHAIPSRSSAVSRRRSAWASTWACRGSARSPRRSCDRAAPPRRPPLSSSRRHQRKRAAARLCTATRAAHSPGGRRAAPARCSPSCSFSCSSCSASPSGSGGSSLRPPRAPTPPPRPPEQPNNGRRSRARIAQIPNPSAARPRRPLTPRPRRPLRLSPRIRSLWPLRLSHHIRPVRPPVRPLRAPRLPFNLYPRTSTPPPLLRQSLLTRTQQRRHPYDKQTRKKTMHFAKKRRASGRSRAPTPAPLRCLLRRERSSTTVHHRSCRASCRPQTRAHFRHVAPLVMRRRAHGGLTLCCRWRCPMAQAVPEDHRVWKAQTALPASQANLVSLSSLFLHM